MSWIPAGAATTTPAIDTLDPSVAHQSGDALAPDLDAGPEREFGMHPRRAVSATRLSVNLDDGLSQLLVFAHPRRGIG